MATTRVNCITELTLRRNDSPTRRFVRISLNIRLRRTARARARARAKHTKLNITAMMLSTKRRNVPPMARYCRATRERAMSNLCVVNACVESSKGVLLGPEQHPDQSCKQTRACPDASASASDLERSFATPSVGVVARYASCTFSVKPCKPPRYCAERTRSRDSRRQIRRSLFASQLLGHKSNSASNYRKHVGAHQRPPRLPLRRRRSRNQSRITTTKTSNMFTNTNFNINNGIEMANRRVFYQTKKSVSKVQEALRETSE